MRRWIDGLFAVAGVAGEPDRRRRGDERPASVVKELVEMRSMPALRHPRRDRRWARPLIRVVDNGSGIAADQLKMAFAEHATSKLSCDDDLFGDFDDGISREALASIGAVAGEDFERVPRARPHTKSRITAGPLAMFQARPGMWDDWRGAEFISSTTHDGNFQGHRNGERACQRKW